MGWRRSIDGIAVEGTVFLWAALLLLTVPLKWLAAAITAAAVHELGHITAVKLLGGEVIQIRIRPTGACIQTAAMEEWKRRIALLAGPLCSLLLLLGLRRFPRVAICGTVQGLYNLLPLPNLDGGQLYSAFQKKPCKESKGIVQ